jgi:SAM-dependent methyltransferase
MYREGGVLVDLGGGIAVHNGVLAQLGMSVYVVDLLSDYWERKAANPTAINREIELLERCGVQFIRGEVSTFDFANRFAANSIDVVASFHCIEHLHQSPKFALESAMQALKPGGLLLIEVPNAANIRKRIALLMGHTNYPAFDSYYYSPAFVGHVREYTVGDLRQLGQNLGGPRYRILGKNTTYGHWVERIPHSIRRVLDAGLQPFPGLCSSLLLEVTKS